MTFALPCKRNAIHKSLCQYHTTLTLIALAPSRTSISQGRRQLDHTASSDSTTLGGRYFPQFVGRSRSFTTTRTLRMASDEDYMAFLDKANRDPSEGYAKPQSVGKHEFKTTDDGAQIPAVIQEATKDMFYTSDSDEPFVPVCLAWDEAGKGLPDEEEFASLIHHPNPSTAQIEIQDPADWDTEGQYESILDAVRKAGKGNDVRVYRVLKSDVKVEYWIVTTEGKGATAKLVGAKALSIET
ncbi:hypothetical protein F4677DRAFT_420109 [Hypoxylon crocopeplum]|nr:hypothetical protein F4677DRAFT_420109 [Hypoxylon crocopeplum]